jgi:hypothetical protein
MIPHAVDGLPAGDGLAVLVVHIPAVVVQRPTLGWAKDDAGQYLYYKDGKPLTGWQDIGGAYKKRYYFDTNAVMVSGKWLQIDGCEVDENGVRKTK